MDFCYWSQKNFDCNVVSVFFSLFLLTSNLVGKKCNEPFRHICLYHIKYINLINSYIKRKAYFCINVLIDIVHNN